MERMVRRHELTDDAWERIQPLPPAGSERGGRRRDQRQAPGGIVWKIRTGAGRRDVPERHGPWQTAYQRFRRCPTPTLRHGSSYEQAEAEICRVEAGEVAVALGPPAGGEVVAEASHRPLLGLRPDLRPHRHGVSAITPLQQQAAQPAQMRDRVGERVADQFRDLPQSEARPPMGRHLPQPLHIAAE
ncbi:transposase [Streptosporangium sandarakinum]